MKKIYKGEVVQYSISGDVIKKFKDVSSVSISNYDSIISCCKGKYKTAGGFIWRFKGDEFNKYKSNKGNIICKICNSSETTRSMAMHLKWVHNIKTEEYIQKHGEFRPKNLKNTNLLKNSNFKCEICNTKVKSNQHLMYHITQNHPDISQTNYILKYFYKNNPPLCKCGCGGTVEILINGRNCDLNKETYNRDYIKGHWDWEVFTGIGKQSKEEIELTDFIKKIYKGTIETSKRGIIKNREIDIYLSELKIGIEYNGLYWHSEKGGRMKEYHINKMKEANKNGIRLIQIFSDEWLQKKEIVKNKIQSILKLTTPHQKIYARKCIIKEIHNPKIKNDFLNQNHIQGEDRSKIKIGLFYEEDMVAIITFSKPRMILGEKLNQEGVWELSRYATSQNIIGGASKLIKYFERNHQPSQIYSYSDNRWTDPKNNMYISSGFKNIRTSKPGYYYTKNYLTKFHRFRFSKQNLKKKGIDITNKTEKQIMDDLGYTRIWDCGTTRYELNFP